MAPLPSFSGLTVVACADSVRRSTRDVWGFGVAWEAGLPHKTSSPSTQRWNGRAFSSLTARAVAYQLELLLADPGKFWLSASEQTADGIDQDRVGRPGLERAGLLEGQIRSTHRLPLTLAVPWERLRQRTPNRKARSARLFVGSTPCWARKTQSESISRSRRRANRPASSWRS